jgi:hypothetical protein
MRIGFLHAHQSAIGEVDASMAAYDMARVHFVEPGILYRITTDPEFARGEARSRVLERVRWISECGVDALVVTCTNYVALMGDESFGVPVIKIDEPFFASVCGRGRPQAIFFSNPATVAGTMERLHRFAEAAGAPVEAEARVVPDVYHLLSQGRAEEYGNAIAAALRQAAAQGGADLSVAQVSMASAARQVGEESGLAIAHPLGALAAHLEGLLGLKQWRPAGVNESN